MEIIIIFILILLNGFFSMAEIALVSSRKARLEAQAAKGDNKAAEALKLSNQPEKFLSTVQIGITLIGVLTGIFSGENFKEPIISLVKNVSFLAPYANIIATTIVVVLITFFSILFGELLPKRIGLSNPERFAKVSAGIMNLVSKITHPFIWLLNTCANVFVKLLNIKSDESQVTEEEIKAIISEGTEQGTIEEAEQEIIERVFHLGDRNITSLMTHRSDIIWLPYDSPLQQVKETIKNNPHSYYPACENDLDDVKGIVHIKDLFLSKDNTIIKECVKPALFVPDNNTAYQVLEKLKEKHTHVCFIANEYGSIEGMITLNDILEAIVGDMPQPDTDDYSISERNDGSFLVDGQISYFDFLAYFNKTEWHSEKDAEEFDTIAGFVLHQLKQIPKTGETFDWKGFSFEIIDMDGVRIDKLLVKINEAIKVEMN
jgi:putative hemolysin